jgi:hypothetical protein
MIICFFALRAGAVGFIIANSWFFVGVVGVRLFVFGCWFLLVFLLVCWRCRFGYLPAALAFPCFHVGLFVLPLCGAALTFCAAAKKVSKESGSHRQL